MNEEFTYVGNELELFAEAKNWKSYVFGQVAPYLGNDVLEVGAGCGGSTMQFAKKRVHRWVCLEPDAELAAQLQQRLENKDLPEYCELTIGTLDDIPQEEKFDSLMYLDVMEHIEDDAAEFSRATSFLKPGGHLIILCPAHQKLFTPFDKAIGHFRRYNRRSRRQSGRRAPRDQCRRPDAGSGLGRCTHPF